ncbi:MAG: hypothetical protein JWP61_585, partial [Friedmanniella sp.]|nr:hypothetical protein [Friedmanniella sp.]
FGLDPLSDLPSYLLGRLGLAGAVAPVTVLVALSGLAYGLSTAVALLWARRWDPLAATR